MCTSHFDAVAPRLPVASAPRCTVKQRTTTSAESAGSDVHARARKRSAARGAATLDRTCSATIVAESVGILAPCAARSRIDCARNGVTRTDVGCTDAGSHRRGVATAWRAPAWVAPVSVATAISALRSLTRRAPPGLAGSVGGGRAGDGQRVCAAYGVRKWPGVSTPSTPVVLRVVKQAHIQRRAADAEVQRRKPEHVLPTCSECSAVATQHADCRSLPRSPVVEINQRRARS